MSKFEVQFTPPRLKQSQGPRDESREPTQVVLGPFSAKAVVTFLDVPVGKVARRCLSITARNGEETIVKVAQMPSPESNLSLEWESKELPSHATIDMEIVWKPTKAGICNDAMYIADSRGFRKEVKLVMKSIDTSKKASLAVPAKKPVPQLSKKLKKTTPKKTMNRNVVQQKANVIVPSSHLATSTPSVPKAPLAESNFNASNIFQPPDMSGLDGLFLPVREKENASPATPQVDPFSRLQFTPIAAKVELEYLANLPTPDVDYTKHLVPSIKVTQPRVLSNDLISDISMLASMVTPKTNRKMVTIVDPADQIDDKTFIPGDESEVLEQLSSETYITSPVFHEAPIDRTRTITPPSAGLSTIAEEGEVTGIQSKTFDIRGANSTKKKIVEEMLMTPIARKQVSFSTKELYKPSPKSAWQGSMPNLLDDRESQEIKNIENNRYFFSTLTSSTANPNDSIASTVFRETEIKASSSQFNLNEVGLKPTMSCLDFSTESLLEDVRKKAQSSPHLGKTCPSSTMSFSPPPKLGSRLFDSDGFVAPLVPSNRVRTWGAVKPKKAYKFPVKLTLKSRTETVETQVLYNPDLHLSVNVNPDPFSASMTVDPFLASTMYLDEKTTDKHAQKFKNWLNALVSIPADLDSIKTKIDVGKLFTEVQNKQQVVETREKVVTKFYKTRFDNLRVAAIQLYQSPGVIKVLAAIQPQIEGGAIQIKDDCDLQLQCGLQQQILDLLFCFNTLWLRIGLEVVTGEMIPMTSNSDLHALTRFIIDKIFRNEYLEQKYRKRQLDTVTYKTKLKKHNLNRILCLLFFLDTAKTSKLIKQNPCLFAKNSEFKETREILIRFASIMLAKMGDITRHLRRFGYVLTHKQSYLDEFDYAFNNLAVDLRDGVRLTKVMENILLREDLSCQLRVPAISRTQKVHNVDVALKALAEAEYVIRGDITAKDIADGHREKTLSLLWQIIYKFRAPKFAQAATTIQRSWRKCRLRFLIDRRVAEKREQRMNAAATKIQAAFRGYVVRKWFKPYREMKIRAIVKIQAHVRCFLAVKKYRHQRLMQSQEYCATKIQSFFQMVVVRRQFVQLRTSTIVIQRHFRRYLVMKKERAQFEATRKAAIFVQRRFRANRVRKVARAEFLRQRALVVKVQTRFRATLEMRRVRSAFVAKKKAAIVIQTRWRATIQMRRQRFEFLRMKAAALCIQDRFRATLLMRSERQIFERKKEAVLVIQKRFRELQLMKREHTEFILLKLAVISVQTRFRALLKMRTERRAFLELRGAVVVVQTRFRATLEMRKTRHEFLELRTATINMQRRWRAKVLGKKENSAFKRLRWAAVVFQRYFRAKVAGDAARSEFIKKKTAAIKIQCFFRGHLLSKKLRAEFLRKRAACLTIQRRMRATVLRNNTQWEYLVLRQQVCFVQQKFRATRAMRVQREEFWSLKRATVTIQSRFRAQLAMKKQRSEYLKLRKAAVILQRRWRAKKLMEKQRAEYQKVLQSVVTIQRRFRATLAMRQQKLVFKQTVSVTVKIQKYFRAYLAMKKQRQEFLELRSAAIAIQTRFRAVKLGREQRKSFLELKTAVMKVQDRFRATRAMRQERRKFLELRTSVILVQNIFRAKLEGAARRQEFLELRQKVVFVQQMWQGKLLMRKARYDFIVMRQAAIVLQQKFRARREMRTARNSFLLLKQSVIVIQTRFRANRLMLEERQKFLCLKEATVTLQRHFRSYLLMKEHRSAFQKMKLAILMIQRKWRATLEMRKERKGFLKAREAAVAIQKRWRETRLARMERQKFVQVRIAVLGLQTRIRGFLARVAFQALNTPEMIERRRQNKAAKRIQAVWRGYQARKKHRDATLKAIRERLAEATRRKKESDTVRNQIRDIVDTLQGTYRIEYATGLLRRLERLSRVAPHTLIPHAKFISGFCYGLMAQAIRSEPDKQMIELCSCIVLNMARYEPTKDVAFSETGLTTIAQMLIRWCDKECGIFITLCTLVWLFGQSPQKNEKIRKFLITPEAIYTLRETKRLTVRKEKMRKCIKKPFGCHLTQLPTHIDPTQLPMLEPDYGIIRGRPYVFYSPSFALDTVLATFHVNV